MKLKVMTFNILYGGYEGTSLAVEKRRGRMADLIRREKPDLVGCQEVVDETREWLGRELTDSCVLVGCGRETDCRGEGCPILFRSDRFELLALDTFWLSETPGVPGSRFSDYGQSGCPRFVCSALLWDCRCGGQVRLVNTHLDTMDAPARRLETEQLAAYLEQMPASQPCILTGDFNMQPDDAVLKRFTERLAAQGWSEATAAVSGTYHEFGDCDPAVKIDYILTDAGVERADVVQDPHPAGEWYSDHYAVCAELTLSGKL